MDERLAAITAAQGGVLASTDAAGTRPRVDAASHHAAVLLHDVDTYGVDLKVVVVVSRVKSTRVRSGLRTHPGAGLALTSTLTHNVVPSPRRCASWSAVPGRLPRCARWTTRCTTVCAHRNS
jgi:hypothetical protein